jgi:hypothetical protein
MLTVLPLINASMASVTPPLILVLLLQWTVTMATLVPQIPVTEDVSILKSIATLATSAKIISATPPLDADLLMSTAMTMTLVPLIAVTLPLAA